MTRTTITAALAAIALTITGCGTGGFNAGTPTTSTTPSPTTLTERDQLYAAHYDCSTGEQPDDDTLTIDTAGKDYNSGDDALSGLGCVLDALDTPAYVIARMEATRALDGTQTATWDGYTATWTYHPDDGIDVIISR